MCSILYHATGLRIYRAKFTFNLTSYPALEHEWLIKHLQYWFMQITWITRNEALHTGDILYGAGLPVVRLQTYLREACMVDPSMVGNRQLERIIDRMGGS